MSHGTTKVVLLQEINRQLEYAPLNPSDNHERRSNQDQDQDQDHRNGGGLITLQNQTTDYFSTLRSLRDQILDQDDDNVADKPLVFGTAQIGSFLAFVRRNTRGQQGHESGFLDPNFMVERNRRILSNRSSRPGSPSGKSQSYTDDLWDEVHRDGFLSGSTSQYLLLQGTHHKNVKRRLANFGLQMVTHLRQNSPVLLLLQSELGTDSYQFSAAEALRQLSLQALQFVESPWSASQLEDVAKAFQEATNIKTWSVIFRDILLRMPLVAIIVDTTTISPGESSEETAAVAVELYEVFESVKRTIPSNFMRMLVVTHRKVTEELPSSAPRKIVKDVQPDHSLKHHGRKARVMKLRSSIPVIPVQPKPRESSGSPTSVLTVEPPTSDNIPLSPVTTETASRVETAPENIPDAFCLQTQPTMGHSDGHVKSESDSVAAGPECESSNSGRACGLSKRSGNDEANNCPSQVRIEFQDNEESPPAEHSAFCNSPLSNESTSPVPVTSSPSIAMKRSEVSPSRISDDMRNLNIASEDRHAVKPVLDIISNTKIAIMCALEIECNAIELLFDRVYDEVELGDFYKSPGDMTGYIVGQIGTQNIVLVPIGGMGKTNAAKAASFCRAAFPNLELILVVGICGGVPFAGGKQEIVLGDVIISEGLILFDYGRLYEDGFHQRHCPSDSAGKLPHKVRMFLGGLKVGMNKKRLTTRTHEYLELMRRNMTEEDEDGDWIEYPGAENDWLFNSSYHHMHRSHPPPHGCVCTEEGERNRMRVCEGARTASCEENGCDMANLVLRKRLEKIMKKTDGNSIQGPAVHFGLVASGDQVMKSETRRDELAKQRGVIAFEMEGAGVWGEVDVPCLVIKSVCDYADGHKNKKWQTYATATAAACIKAFLERWKP